MKKLLCLMGAALLFFSSCDGLTGSDDLTSELENRIDGLEERITSLESLTKEINSNVKALQAVLSAIENNDYITKVESIIENGVEIGYAITFAKSGTFNVYHGRNGEKGEQGDKGDKGDAGSTPQIGVRQDTDGFYYWTLDGNWLLDSNNNKIRAIGTDGKDGINGSNGSDGKDGVTPILRINDEGYWEVSVDNGSTWQVLGKAVGEQGPQGEPGKDGEGSIFKDIRIVDGQIVFVTNNDDVYTVPVQSALDIIFDVEQGFGIIPFATSRIGYTIVGGDENTLVRLFAQQEDFMFGAVKPLGPDKGYIYIYSEEWGEEYDDDEIGYGGFEGLTEGDLKNSMRGILVSVSDGKGNSILKSLNVEKGVLESLSPAYIAEAGAGSLSTKVKTNTRYNVKVDCDWLKIITTKAVREDELEFSIEANTTGAFRTALVKLVNDVNQTVETFAIAQKAEDSGDNIIFADPLMEQLCVSIWDENLDGKLSYAEALKVTNVDNLFQLEKGVTSFDEFEYFLSVKSLPRGFAENCTQLKSITIPSNVLVIPAACFKNCSSLSSVKFMTPIEYVYEEAFYGCRELHQAIDLTHMKERYDDLGQQSAFAFSGITSLNMSGSECYSIPSNFCNECNDLETVILSDKCDYIGWSAFAGCDKLKGEWVAEINNYAIVIPSGMDRINENAFSGCNCKVVMYSETPPYCEYAFNNSVKIYVPDEYYENYEDSEISSEYDVFPFSMSNVSISADCNILFSHRNEYGEGRTFYMDVAINQQNLSESGIVEKGIFIKPKDGYQDEIFHYSLESFNTKYRITVVDTQLFDFRDELVYGVYLKKENGSYRYYGRQDYSCTNEVSDVHIRAEVDGTAYYAYAKNDVSYYYIPVSTEWSDMSTFRFVKMNDSDYYAIIDAYDHLLYSQDSYNSFNIGLPEGDNYLWSVSQLEDGTYAVVNKGTGKTIWYSKTYESFGAYSTQPSNSVYPILF